MAVIPGFIPLVALGIYILALVAITVRHAPEQAIEAPSAMTEVSNAVAIVKSTRSPRRTRFTRPKSVMMPVNIPLGYGSAA